MTSNGSLEPNKKSHAGLLFCDEDTFEASYVSAIYPVAANIPPNQRQPNYDDRQTKSGGWVKKKRDHDPRIPEIAQTIRNKFDVFAPAKELNESI
jgi:hypothetical protein